MMRVGNFKRSWSNYTCIEWIQKAMCEVLELTTVWCIYFSDRWSVKLMVNKRCLGSFGLPYIYHQTSIHKGPYRTTRDYFKLCCSRTTLFIYVCPSIVVNCEKMKRLINLYIVTLNYTTLVKHNISVNVS
jgi:hypothetical protein